MLASVWGESFTFYLLWTAFKERPQRPVDDKSGGWNSNTTWASTDQRWGRRDRLRARWRWYRCKWQQKEATKKGALTAEEEKSPMLHFAHSYKTTSSPLMGSFFFLQFCTVLFRFQKFLVKNVTIECLDMRDVLNVDKKKSIAQFTCKLRHQSFESNCAII